MNPAKPTHEPMIKQMKMKKELITPKLEEKIQNL
jgi:hypothetical protein